ncbi:MAG: hypothetical protein IKK78_01265 [Oscillospiraceae bacterium]|nr:hypothetical protein [Oscillospiraceae bacterium]
MTRTEFFELCQHNNISTNLIHFESSVAEGYYVLKNSHCWEVFFRERGKDYACMGFPSESNDLEYLLEKLLKA